MEKHPAVDADGKGIQTFFINEKVGRILGGLVVSLGGDGSLHRIYSCICGDGSRIVVHALDGIGERHCTPTLIICDFRLISRVAIPPVTDGHNRGKGLALRKRNRHHCAIALRKVKLICSLTRIIHTDLSHLDGVGDGRSCLSYPTGLSLFGSLLHLDVIEGDVIVCGWRDRQRDGSCSRWVGIIDGDCSVGRSHDVHSVISPSHHAAHQECYN